MSYGIKYRIIYCDKNNVEAKVEIEVRGYSGAVQNVEGTPDVFSLRYDLGGKQNNIISSFADINLFENPITIDDLKTLNETDIRVSFYIANVLKWQGFALPDFFETDIKNNAVISISATDRLSVLKDKTIGGFEVNVTPIRLISEVLNQTGLALNINSIINFSASGVTDVMRHLTLDGQRLTDDRGRNISAYDILSSLLALFNSYIVQRNNEWYIINKWQLENGGGTLYKYNASGAYQSSSTFTPTQVSFDEISAGGRRKIEAGALEVSLFGEYGGMPIYPNNCDFRLWGLSGFDGWSAKNGFVAMMNQNEVIGYSGNSAIIGSGSVKRRLKFTLIRSEHILNPYLPSHLESDEWLSLSGSEAEIKISINATSKNNTVFGVGIIVKDAEGNLWTQNESSIWKKRDSNHTGGIYMRIAFDDETSGANDVVSISANIGASIRASDLGEYILSLSGASAKMVIFGVGKNDADVFISSAKIAISQSGDQPQGTLFKVQQQNDFSKKFDTQTIIFSDHVRSGINGHFYPYRSDDTSIIRPIAKFSANGETDYLALLSARQASRLFSSARDVLTITIDASNIDPLAVYVCGSKKYIATESVFDFFRSKLDLRLEENVVNNTAKKDFVYSYFGEGEDTIKSIGGIAGGGGGAGSGGGGMTSSQLEMLTNLADWWKLDEENDAIYSEKSVYSLKGVSALGLGSGGGGGGGDFDRLDAWVDYNETKANWVLSALLGYDLHTRVNSLEDSGGSSNIDIAITGSGNAVTNVSKSGNTLTFDKGINFALSTHNHTIANITGLQDALDGKEPSFTKNTAFNKDFGTVAGTVMQGNDSRIHSHSNKALLDLISQSNIDVLSKLSLDAQGNIKVDATLWATGGISALGLGEGGGSSGGGIDMLDSWANYTTAKANFYAPASLLVPFRNDTLSRLTSLESGSATSIVTTGSGNAITSLTKSGSVITATKGLTFALASHTHTIAQITGLQGALDLKASQSDIDTAIDGIEIGGRNLVKFSDVTNRAGLTKTQGVPPIFTLQNESAGGLRIPNALMTVGELYVFSFSVKKTSGDIKDIAGHSTSFQNTKVYLDDTLIGTSWHNGTLNSYPNDLLEHRYKIVFEYNGATPSDSFYIQPNRSSGYNMPYACDIYNLKLEKGTKATDWTPAPEDQVSDWNETDVNSFAFIKNKPTTLGGYGITDAIQINSDNWANFRCTAITEVNKDVVEDVSGSLKLDEWYYLNVGATSIYGTRLTIAGKSAHDKTQLYFNGANGSIQYRKSWYPNRPWTSLRTIWDSGNLTNLNQLTTRNFSDLQNKPTTLSGYGITDAVTTNTTQTITGAKTFSSLLTASAGTNTPKVDFGNGFTIEPSGTELVFKYNGVIKQRMLSNGTILATGGITALST